MTTTAAGPIELTFLERLTITVGRTGMGKTELARWLEMNPASVSRWFMGMTLPPASTLRLIALQAQVPYEWLRPTPSELEDMGRGGKYTPWDLNPEPTD